MWRVKLKGHLHDNVFRQKLKIFSVCIFENEFPSGSFEKDGIIVFV